MDAFYEIQKPSGLPLRWDIPRRHNPHIERVGLPASLNLDKGMAGSSDRHTTHAVDNRSVRGLNSVNTLFLAFFRLLYYPGGFFPWVIYLQRHDKH